MISTGSCPHKVSCGPVPSEAAGIDGTSPPNETCVVDDVPSTVSRRARIDSRVRFWSKVERRENGCWEWMGGRGRHGHGRFRPSPEVAYEAAHRFAYIHLVAEIPDGLVIDHLCRNPCCVNPAHLEPVTNVENVRRGLSPHAQNGRKTHCKRGHAFTVDTTGTTKLGHRYCLICARNKSARRRKADQSYVELHAGRHALLVEWAHSHGRAPTLAEVQELLGLSMQASSRARIRVFGTNPDTRGEHDCA